MNSPTPQLPNSPIPDVPRNRSGNVFLVYSKLQRVDRQLIIPSAPQAALVPVIESMTGFDSVSGEYKGEYLDITPVIDGDAVRFELLGHAQNVHETGGFSVMVSTKGDPDRNIDGVTVSFTFRVALFEKDTVFAVDNTLIYRVGDQVDTYLGLLFTNGAIDYHGHTGDLRHPTETYIDDKGNTVHYSSGLSITRRDNQPPRLHGVAARPGIYFFDVGVQTWSEGGQWDNLPDSFRAGRGTLPFMVTIIDDYYVENTLITRSEAICGYRDDFLRVLWHQALYEHEYDMAEANGAYTLGDDGAWTRSARNGGHDYYYRVFKDDDGRWRFQYLSSSTREMTDFDTTRPAYPPGIDSKLMTHPPNAGWSRIRVAGSGKYMVSDDDNLYGFFDYKGQYRVGENEDGEPVYTPVYEQQMLYTNQYGYEDEPDAVRFNQGYYLRYSDEHEEYILFGPSGTVTGITLQTPQETAVPYAPPTRESCGGYTVRDICAGNICLHRDVNNLLISSGESGGGFWNYYPLHRVYVPFNGTSGDMSYPGSVTFTYEVTNEESGSNLGRSDRFFGLVDPEWGIPQYVPPGTLTSRTQNTTERKSAENYSISMSISPYDSCRRDNDTIKAFYGFQGEPSFDYNNYYYYDMHEFRDNYFPDPPLYLVRKEEYKLNITSKINSAEPQDTGLGLSQFFITTAPYHPSLHAMFGAISARMNAAVKINRIDTHKGYSFNWENGDPHSYTDEHEYNYILGGNADVCEYNPVPLEYPRLTAGSYSRESGTRYYYLYQLAQPSDDRNPIPKQVDSTVHITWSGTTVMRNGKLSMSESSATVKMVLYEANDIIEEKTYDDPDQSVFESLKEKYENFEGYADELPDELKPYMNPYFWWYTRDYRSEKTNLSKITISY